MGMEDDLELFDRWASGDVDAGQRLVLRHYDAVYFFFANKLADHVAVELTQATFETMCRRASSLHIHSSFVSYLFGIARWKLVEHFRRHSAQGFDPLSDSFPDPGMASSLTAAFDREREEAQLVQALRQLPLDDQILLELRIYEALRLREIGEILGVTKEEVATRLALAKRRLMHAAHQVAPDEDSLTSLSAYMRGIRAALSRRFEEVDHAEGG
jgi:RNA polymerase sigma factor (sigma-70 family)